MDFVTVAYLEVTLSRDDGGIACAIDGTCMATLGRIVSLDGFEAWYVMW